METATVERKWSPMHLIIDCRCSNTAILTNKELLSRWVEEMCGVIGMTPVGEFKSEDFPFPGGDNCISAYQQAVRFIPFAGAQFLGESGIILHPYPEFDYLFLDIFSCMDFDAGAALEFIRNTLGVTDQISYLFKRGIDMETRRPIDLIPTFI